MKKLFYIFVLVLSFVFQSVSAYNDVIPSAPQVHAGDVIPVYKGFTSTQPKVISKNATDGSYVNGYCTPVHHIRYYKDGKMYDLYFIQHDIEEIKNGKDSAFNVTFFMSVDAGEIKFVSTSYCPNKWSLNNKIDQYVAFGNCIRNMSDKLYIKTFSHVYVDIRGHKHFDFIGTFRNCKLNIVK